VPRCAVAIACGVLFGGLAAAVPTQAQPLNRLPPARAPCSVLSGQPCHPSFCGVFHLRPCFPYYLPPLGQDLQLTIVSTDGDAAENVRESAALQRCTPLHFSAGMAGAVAGRPIAIRFVDERTTDTDSGK
jgi:hypothetical protein